MKTAKLLIGLGVALLAFSLSLWVLNLRQDAAAGASAEAVLTRLRPDSSAVQLRAAGEDAAPAETPLSPLPLYQLDPEMPMPTQTVDGIEYLGVLEIPAITLELPVISRWSYADLKHAPCRYSGSAYLDDMVLAGHNYESHFGGLRELRANDLVCFTDMDGNEFRYLVSGLEVLDRDDTEEMLDPRWDLTMFTCTLGGGNRIAVRCLREDSEAFAFPGS